MTTTMAAPAVQRRGIPEHEKHAWHARCWLCGDEQMWWARERQRLLGDWRAPYEPFPRPRQPVYGDSNEMVLALIDESPGITTQELAEQTGLSRPWISELVRGLAEGGLIRRERAGAAQFFALYTAS